MLSKASLMLRSARGACPRLELGARLEARRTAMQPISTHHSVSMARQILGEALEGAGPAGPMLIAA